MSPLRATFSFFAVEGSHEYTFDEDGRPHRQRNALKSAIAIYGCHLAWITRECSERVPTCRAAISWTTQICTARIHKGLRQLRQKLATLYLVASYFRLRFHFKASSLMESDKGLGNARSSETRFQWLLSIKDRVTVWFICCYKINDSSSLGNSAPLNILWLKVFLLIGNVKGTANGNLETYIAYD